MSTLNEERVRELLVPFLGDAAVPENLYPKLRVYLDLLVKWNARTNLTAIRDPVEIVRRHFGESLFLGRHLPQAATMLDYGSGAGFPGLPIQLLLPELRVTLAESQGKKASFLREAAHALELEAEIWPRRVEAMSAQKSFDIVALRAVDKMEEAIQFAKRRIMEGGTLALLVSGTEGGIPVPGSDRRLIRFIPWNDVPRGTHPFAEDRLAR